MLVVIISVRPVLCNKREPSLYVGKAYIVSMAMRRRLQRADACRWMSRSPSLFQNPKQN